MICRVEMPTNEQIFGRFYRYRLMHGQGQGGGRSMVIMLAILVAAMLMLFFTFSLSVWLLVGAAALVVLWLGYLMWWKPNQLFRKKEGAALQTEVTIFTKSGVTRTVKSEEGGLPETTSVNYSTMLKAVETGQDFFLFLSPAQAIMVDKEYFTNGTPEELRAVLKDKLGANFKGKKS